MTPESRKAFNTYMGLMLIVLAMLCFGFAGYMILVPAAEKTAPPPKIAVINKQLCLDGLKALGFQVRSLGQDIQVMDRTPDVLPLDRLKNASLGTSMCQMYLKSFCMGSTCPDQHAMTFTLTQDEPGASRAKTPLPSPARNSTPAKTGSPAKPAGLS